MLLTEVSSGHLQPQQPTECRLACVWTMHCNTRVQLHMPHTVAVIKACLMNPQQLRKYGDLWTVAVHNFGEGGRVGMKNCCTAPST